MMNFTFEKAQGFETAKLKALWIECFDEKPEAVDLIFDKHFNNFVAYIAKDNSKIVSALYLIKCKLNGKNAHYLCGAGTSTQYRGKRIMGRLIEFALNDAKNDGDVYSVLMPASDSLYRFYTKFGYAKNCNAKIVKLSRNELESISVKGEKADCSIEKMQTVCFKNNFLCQSEKFFDFAKAYYEIYGIKCVADGCCFAFFDEDNGCADVFYSAYSDFDSLKNLLLKHTDLNKFRLVLKSDNKQFLNGKIEKYGMIKSLDDSEIIPENVFVGITLS